MRKSSMSNLFIVAIISGLAFGIAMKMTTSVINKSKVKEGFGISGPDIGLIICFIILVGVIIGSTIKILQN